MKVLITGHKGQLGQALLNLAPAGTDVTGVDLPEVDITSPESLRAACVDNTPELIINSAAYTAVDQAESEAELAFRINRDGTWILAEFARETEARLIHVSTDFVFDGRRSSPYLPEDDTQPLNVYGNSKREGERSVLEILPGNSVIIRTAWLYGKDGGNFVRSILRLLAERDELKIVADQVGTPTWTHSLAEAVWAFAQHPALAGIYHWTDAGAASWYDFAVAIQEEALAIGLLDRQIPVLPISTEQYPTPARRPSYSVLDKTASYRDLDIKPVHWRANLRNMLNGMKSQ